MQPARCYSAGDRLLEEFAAEAVAAIDIAEGAKADADQIPLENRRR